MTNFGKTISALIVVVVAVLIIWFVAQKPVAIAPVTTDTVQQTQTTDSVTAQTSGTTDQSLDQDAAAIDAQLEGLSSDTSAAATVSQQ